MAMHHCSLGSWDLVEVLVLQTTTVQHLMHLEMVEMVVES